MQKLFTSPVRRNSLKIANTALAAAQQTGRRLSTSALSNTASSGPAQESPLATLKSNKPLGLKNANLAAMPSSARQISTASAPAIDSPGAEVAKLEAERPQYYTPIAEKDRATHRRNQDAMASVYGTWRQSPAWTQAMADMKATPEHGKYMNFLRGGRESVQATITPEYSVPIIEKDRLEAASHEWCRDWVLYDNLFRLGREAGVDNSIYRGKDVPGELNYSRNALLKVDDHVVQVFGWKPKLPQPAPLPDQKASKTKVHDHLNAHNCTSVVVQGEMMEYIHYPSNTAVMIDGELRTALEEVNHRALGSVAGFGLGNRNRGHSLANESDDYAVTYHAYKMDGTSPGQEVNFRLVFPDTTPEQNARVLRKMRAETSEFGKILEGHPHAIEDKPAV